MAEEAIHAAPQDSAHPRWRKPPPLGRRPAEDVFGVVDLPQLLLAGDRPEVIPT
jgi:hypothetical protein